jgi:transcriptional regulatory protein RtcR
MARRRNVVIGLLGITLDQGKHSNRWEKWRPSVALCQHDDLLIDRFELLHQRRASSLAERIKRDIGQISPETEVRLHRVEFDDPWDFEEVYGALHDFAREYPFDTDREDYLVNITTGTHVAQICLFLLAESHRIPADIIQESPPPRRRSNETGTYRIIDLDLSKYDSIHSRFHNEQLEETSLLKSGIDTRNKAFNKLIEQIERVATHSTAPMLLTGPTGAGKSLLARRIYELKKARRLIAGKFVEVNCATLRGDAAMSALFGHVKGAFTGAAKDRPGLLRAADGGLLFLDEVGELGTDEQAMFLRALEEKRFLPLGSDKETGSDFQLIAGTNRDLKVEVSTGRFRDDLLARIDLWTFRLPGLCDRREDIEPNLAYELDQYTTKTGHVVTFNKEGRDRFLKFAKSPRAEWPANFRDLNGAVTRMATLAPGGRITVEVVKEELARLGAMWAGPASGQADDPVFDVLGADAAERMDLFDRAQLAEVIRVCRRSKSLSEAGRGLFAVSRKRKRIANDADRLRKYLARFSLDWRALATR